ncbi:MAG: hypothetical protein Q8N84_02930 [bacterium]|nr:hypothetical protein [bacterium]
MSKLLLTTSLLLLSFWFLFPAQLRAACVEGEWSARTDIKGEKWQGDYGACGGGRYRCHSYCWDKWSLQCVGGQWVDKWIAASGCSKDTVCRATEGAWGRNCDCCTLPSHQECNTASNKCVSVPGVGADKCQNDSECASPTHNECQNLSCVYNVPGSGPNKCTKDEDCRCQCQETRGACGDGILCPTTERVVWRECTPNQSGLTCDPKQSRCENDPTCQLTPAVSVWFQTAKGDVATAGGLVVNIPAESQVKPFGPAFEGGSYFSLGKPEGAVFASLDPVSFGNGNVSAGSSVTGHDPWLAKKYPLLSTKLAGYNFSFFDTTIWHQKSVVGGTLSGGAINGVSLAGLEKGQALHVEGNLAVKDGDNLDGVEALILISGTLSFGGDFAPANSAIFFVSQGGVSVNGAVKNIRAAILTDAQIGLGVANPKPTDGLLLEGMYLANSGEGNLILQRGRENNEAPAVMLAYAPEIIVKLTESFGRSRVISWREVIAGKK